MLPFLLIFFVLSLDFKHATQQKEGKEQKKEEKSRSTWKICTLDNGTIQQLLALSTLQMLPNLASRVLT